MLANLICVTILADRLVSYYITEKSQAQMLLKLLSSVAQLVVAELDFKLKEPALVTTLQQRVLIMHQNSYCLVLYQKLL